MRIKSLSSIGNMVITKDASFESLGFVGQEKNLMLVFAEGKKYVDLANSNDSISVVLTKEEYKNQFRDNIAVVLCDNPKKSFYEIHNYLTTKTDFYGKDTENRIAPSVKIYPNVYIAPKNVTIGENVILEPNTVIWDKVIIEDNVIIRAGSVIGSEGFQYIRLDNEILSVKHSGGVILRRGVEIGSNCCIDRALFGGFTEVGEDTKIDNLVHIAHEVKIGKRVFLPAGVIFSGSVVVEDDVWIGPNATISNEIEIGKNAFISLGAVVTRNVKEGERVSGNFAIQHEKLLNFLIKLSRTP